jgi:hypothetical protein
MKLTSKNIGHFVKIRDSLQVENEGVWLRILSVGSDHIIIENPNTRNSWAIADYQNRVTDLCEVTTKKKLEFSDIEVGMWIKIKSSLRFDSTLLQKNVGKWLRVDSLGPSTRRPCSDGYFWDEREIEDISEFDPTLSSHTIIEELKETKMISENQLKELGDIESENLIKAKELADKELATRQQERASQIYKEILNELEEVNLSIKKSTERKTVLEEALKKYSK